MNTRLITGFIAGIGVVVIICCFLFNPIEKFPISDELPIDQIAKTNTDKSTTNPGVTKNPGQPEDDRNEGRSLSPEAIEKDITPKPAEIEVVPDGIDRQKTLSGDDSTMPAEENTFEAVTNSQKKFFFWKPFSLKSRAEKFAHQMSSRSGLTCRAEKTGIGKYKVYFSYLDDAEKINKMERISNTGIAVQ